MSGGEGGVQSLKGKLTLANRRTRSCKERRGGVVRLYVKLQYEKYVRNDRTLTNSDPLPADIIIIIVLAS